MIILCNYFRATILCNQLLFSLYFSVWKILRGFYSNFHSLSLSIPFTSLYMYSDRMSLISKTSFLYSKMTFALVMSLKFFFKIAKLFTVIGKELWIIYSLVRLSIFWSMAKDKKRRVLIFKEGSGSPLPPPLLIHWIRNSPTLLDLVNKVPYLPHPSYIQQIIILIFCRAWFFVWNQKFKSIWLW